MKQERRNDMRWSQGHYPFALGLIVSALFHLLFVLLNPGVAPSYGRAGGTPAAPAAPGAHFTVLSLSPRDEDDLIHVEATPPTPTLRPPRFGTTGAAPVETGGSGRDRGPETGAEATVAERLRYNARPFSAPVAPMRETVSQRALRETRERVLRAAEELGPLPPNGVAGSRSGGGRGGGISIPFGFKPPPPAQTVPAPPLPDWMVRRDSIRAAARTAVRMDSLRAARDTTRLRNVAPRRPLIIPRVVPDTTARALCAECDANADLARALHDEKADDVHRPTAANPAASNGSMTTSVAAVRVDVHGELDVPVVAPRWVEDRGKKRGQAGAVGRSGHDLAGEHLARARMRHAHLCQTLHVHRAQGSSRVERHKYPQETETNA